jgi:1-acyl-sn-glycerol-3-phosphate acyltransferase
MSTVRSTVRGVALALWTALTGLALLLATLLGRLSRPAGARLAAGAFRTWARGTARIVGLKIVRSGTPPRPPFFLVANHLGYLDVVVLAATLDATFVAKSDVAAWPLVGRLCAAVGTVFVDRSRKRDLLRVLPLLDARLCAGDGVVVFPEGTTGDGSAVLPFRSPLFAAAARRGLPVHLATLGYATPAGAPHPARAVCWWGDMEFVPHLRALLALPSCTARVHFAAAAVPAGARKPVARAAQRAIARRFVPVHQGESPCNPVPVPPMPTSASSARASICSRSSTTPSSAPRSDPSSATASTSTARSCAASPRGASTTTSASATRSSSRAVASRASATRR